MGVTIVEGRNPEDPEIRATRAETRVRELMREIRQHEASKRERIVRPDHADQQLHRAARRILGT